MVHVAILVLLSWLHTTIAGFTQATRWSGTNLIIEHNSAGTWCFLPVAGETTAVDCKGSQADLQGSLTAHLQQQLSIAYYNPIDNTRLGGPTWSITNTTLLIHLCASGKGGDGIIQTICSTVNADNQFQGTPYCEVAVGPSVVSDGCYSDAPTTTAAVAPPTKTSPTSSSTTTSNSANPTPDDPISSTLSSTTTSSSPTSTTINVITDSKQTNWVTEIFVPILCAVIGIVAAVIAANLCCGYRFNFTRAVQYDEYND